MSDKKAIVIDNKADYIRAGLAGDNGPKVIFRTDSVTAKSPIANTDVITDWAGMESVWAHTFAQLGVDPAQHPILISEPPLNTQTNRNKTMQLLFGKFNTPAVHLATAPMLELYDAGLMTGTVLSIGERVIYTVPIYNGYALPHAIIRMDFGGAQLSNSAAGGIPEALFQPALIHIESAGISETVYNSVMKCEPDYRLTMYKNILLSGSSANYPGLAARLQEEVAELAPPTARVKVIESVEAKNAAWRGGNKLAPDLAGYDMWTSKEKFTG